ncbi:MAG TPA: F0F1 ATP synthase subunit delta [Candidatus Saccharimonadales bacterium]|nr:F0F1 ATP synthase subunit delta [Candidatus Saccharimonadales bacterium]
MKTPRTRIASAVSKRLGTTGEKTLSQEVAAYLLSENRVGELDSLLRDVMQQRADAGIVEVIAVSAYPLSDKVRTNIKARIKAAYPNAKSIIVSEEIDPSLVGGVRLELANQQLDLSVRAKLNKFKQVTADRS